MIFMVFLCKKKKKKKKILRHFWKQDIYFFGLRFFKSHRIFRPSYNTFYEEKNKTNQTLLCSIYLLILLDY